MILIRRILAWLAAAFVVLLVARLIRRASAVRVASSRATPRFEGAMVRDRICETFVPRARALALRTGGEEHFFCSEACRAAFLARHRAVR